MLKDHEIIGQMPPPRMFYLKKKFKKGEKAGEKEYAQTRKWMEGSLKGSLLAMGNGLHMLRRQLDAILQLQLSLGITLERLEIDNQVILHCKHRIAAKILVIAREYLRRDGLVLWVTDHEMDMRGTERVSVCQMQKDTSGPIGGQ